MHIGLFWLYGCTSLGLVGLSYSFSTNILDNEHTLGLVFVAVLTSTIVWKKNFSVLNNFSLLCATD